MDLNDGNKFSYLSAWDVNMGNNTSLPLTQVPPGFSTMCISLQEGDSISVLHHDSEALYTIQQAIVDSWPDGIQNEMSVCGSGWLFKVKGNTNTI